MYVYTHIDIITLIYEYQEAGEHLIHDDRR